MNNIILEIAKCCEVEKAKLNDSHSCNKIVMSQNDSFQLPEPWNGHLDNAEILFISSNPSIDPNENYPTASWKDEDIVSFFENRFEITPKNEWSTYYGTEGGVKLIKLDSVLGLDFRAVIICGLITLGEYDKTKNPDWNSLKNNEEERNNAITAVQENIRRLYVACTRAKEVLHIIQTEEENQSIYIKMLQDSLEQ